MAWGAWLLVFFFLLLAAAFWPVWPYSVGWGYYPAAGVGFLFFIFLILLIVGAFAAGVDDSGRGPRARPRP